MSIKEKITACVLSLSILTSMPAAAAVTENIAENIVICDMMTDDLVNPVGIDNEKPLFSWKMSSSTVGQKQTAYRIVVEKGGTQVWDSGRVESELSVGISYGGDELVSSTEYNWTVKVWDKDGKTAVSDKAYFETGLLESGAFDDTLWISHKELTPKEIATVSNSLNAVVLSETEAGTVPDGWSFDNTTAIVNADPDGDGINENMLFLGSSTGTHSTTAIIPLPQSDFVAEIAVAIDHSKMLAGILDFGVGKDSMSSYYSLSLPKRTESYHGDKAGTLELHSGTARQSANFKATFDSNNKYTELTMTLYVANGMLEAYYNGVSVGCMNMVSSAVTDGKCNLYLSADWSDVYIKKLSVKGLTVNAEKDAELPAYRKSVEVKENLKSAKLYTSALGVYETYVNGERVGRLQEDGSIVYDELKPGFTEPSGRKFYSSYDITHMLSAGENVISSVVSSGWYTGEVVGTQIGNNRNAYLAKLILTYEDGKQEVITTDTTWKSAKVSPIQEPTGIFEGETYNAAADLSYMLPGFDDSGWEYVIENNQYNGIITAWRGSPVRVREDLRRDVQSLKKYTSSDITGATAGYYGTIKFKAENIFDAVPTEGIRIAPGEKLIVDFGQNGAGWEYFELEAPAGTVVTVRHSEALCEGNGSADRGNCGPEGSLYTTSNRGAAATTKYIASGKGVEAYHPTHTFYGFRYIEISVTDTVIIHTISAQTVTSALRDTGRIVTSDKDVNRLIDNVRRSMYSNFLSVPTDCPQRNERQGWTGDIQIFSQTASYLGFSKSFLMKFMDDMRDVMKKKNTAAFPAIAPNGIYGNGYGNIGWSDAGIIIPYTVYSMYGDTSVIEENWDLMSGYLTYLENLGPFLELSQNAKVNLMTYCGHLSLEMNADIWSVDGILDDAEEKIQTCIAYFAWDARLMAEMAGVLGKTDEAEKYNAIYEAQKAYYIENFVNADGTVKAETQQSYLFALYLDLLPDEASVNAVTNQLISNITSKGLKLQTGFLGTGILLPTLTKVGRSDIAYSLLLSHDYPSWLYAVDHGATTMWERWDTYVEEKGWNRSGMNSLNHYAYGCAVGWMFNNAVGIGNDTQNAGFKHTVFEPNPDPSLSSVAASYESAYGEIRSAYAYSGSDLFYSITVPANTTASVKLPVDIDYADAVRVNGKSLSELDATNDGIKYIGYKNGRALFEVVSGSFDFAVMSKENLSYVDVINNYDDQGVIYDCSEECGDGNGKHRDGNSVMHNTYRTVNGNTDKLALHATVEQTVDAFGKITNAVKLPNVQGYTNGYPRAVQIYDSNDGNLSFFKTEAGEEYTVTLKYRLDSFTSGHDVNLELRGGEIKDNIKYGTVLSYGNITEKAITAETQKGIWKTATLRFTAKTSDLLHIAAVTVEASDVNWKTSNTVGLELWLDDISVTKTGNTVICHDWDGISDKTADVNSAACFAQLPVPTRNGFVFAGWYLDEDKTVPVDAAGRISGVSQIWAKWQAAVYAPDTGSLMTFDEDGLAYEEYAGNYSNGRGYVSNKLTVGDSDWLSIRAGVVSTEDGNAMSVQRVTAQKSAAPSTFKLYNPKNFLLYTVTAGEKYTVTFNYKLLQQINNNGSTKWDKVYFQLRKNKMTNSNNYSYVESEQYALSDAITSETAVGEWHTVTLSFTAPETTQLEIAAVTNFVGGAWSNIDGNKNDSLKANVDILVDDIMIRGSYKEPENCIRGDMNDDKKVDIRDFVHLKKAVAGVTEKTTVSDVNRDGAVDALDITELKKILLSL